ncbi:fungal peroxidase [Exidia glandulosa HHB12029]|uniref:Fungal peroxidase n=1 Tax=Exidia glandulosa HHB12029 TaxID=1314781 RepID=A0A165IL81_EXIGL|nr:fungal peroxidase [Exidia glandulosa HHB12029]
MRVSSLFFAVLAVFLASAPEEVAARGLARRAAANPAAVKGARKASLLKSVPGLPALPSLAQTVSSDIPINDVQGDIVVGMLKPQQIFYFFTIQDAATFKTHLSSDIAPIITSAQQMLDRTKEPLVLLNMAFSQKGLQALGVADALGDQDFFNGQFSDVQGLGDVPGEWKQEFAGGNVHGVILIASDTKDLIEQQVTFIESTLGASIAKVYELDAAMRPNENAGHEMFGFKDGIAQPFLTGFGSKLPGQTEVAPGAIVVGLDGDTSINQRPSGGWMTGGSFLAFRQLEQHVPEFNKFLLDNAPAIEGKTLQERADFLGSRIVGRWKSGAPIDLSPDHDDPALGANNQTNNNFDFTHPEIAGFDIASDQSRCPFSAHIRKTRPRADLAPGVVASRSILRSGIPYGPEVTDDESASNTTKSERGLAFVAYQSTIANGFKFLQEAWANKPSFVPGKNVNPGFDPLIGQAPNGGPRNVTGLDPANPTGQTTFPTQFIVSRGGEYFFSPPISAFKGRLVQ